MLTISASWIIAKIKWIPVRKNHLCLSACVALSVTRHISRVVCNGRHGGGTLLIVRALYVYWYLIDGVIKGDPVKIMDSDVTGLYVLVRFYKRHGWVALIGILGNLVLSTAWIS